MQGFFDEIVVDIASINAVSVKIEVERAFKLADIQTVRNEWRHFAHIDMEICANIVARPINVSSREFYGARTLVGFEMQLFQIQPYSCIIVALASCKVNIKTDVFHLRIIGHENQSVVEFKIGVDMRIMCCIADISTDIGAELQFAFQLFNANLVEQTIGHIFGNIGKINIFATGVNVGVDAVGYPCRAADGYQNIVERERHIVNGDVLAHIIDIYPQFGHLQFVCVGRVVVHLRNLHFSFYLRLNSTVGKGTLGCNFRNVGFGMRAKFAVIINQGYITDCKFLKVDNKTKRCGIGYFWSGVGRHKEIVTRNTLFVNKIFDCGAFEFYFGDFNFAIFQGLGFERDVHFFDINKRVGFGVSFENGAEINVVEFECRVWERTDERE